MKKRVHKNKGFTLVELMVAITLMTLMATIIFASLSQAREGTREKKRVADLANIEFALTLHNEKERSFPSYNAGVRIGTGGGIDAIITQFNGNTYNDPSYQAGTYEYWYDSSFTCSAPGQVVIYARRVEQSKNANYTELCTHPSRHTTNGAGTNSYIVVVQ